MLLKTTDILPEASFWDQKAENFHLRSATCKDNGPAGSAEGENVFPGDAGSLDRCHLELN